MNNGTILKKAIEKAVKNGWEIDWKDDYLEATEEENPLYCYDVIFSHDFAEAFWGKEIIRVYSGGADFARAGGGCSILTWKHHLQQMVLEKDPLKYLEKFLT